jgi:hypothetical protein
MSRPRIGIACPIPGERAALIEWLEAGGYTPVPMSEATSIARELESDAFEVLIIDSDLASAGDTPSVLRNLGNNRPLVVIGDADSTSFMEPRRDVTHMSRPVEKNSLLLAVTLALAEGRPARRFPRRNVPRLQATLDGVPARLLDVSYGGIRIELAGKHRSSLPPFFTVKVPMFGVGVAVQRVWVNAAMRDGSKDNLWCGVTIARNPDRAKQGWQTLVDQAPTSEAYNTQRVTYL